MCIFRSLEFKIQSQNINISDEFGSSNTWVLVEKHRHAARLIQPPFQSEELFI